MKFENNEFFLASFLLTNSGSFLFASPLAQLSGCISLHPRDARAIFLLHDLQCNGTCFVTGGSITYGGHKRKRSQIPVG